jgi:predicted alpha/beta superfamily hydrolase
MQFQNTMLAQYNVQFIIQQHQQVQSTENIFFASNINNWQPNNGFFQFKKTDDTYLLYLKNIPAQLIEYKITKGSWQKVECDNNKQAIENRIANIQNDTIIYIEIAQWLQPIEKAHVIEKVHTISKNVQVITPNFTYYTQSPARKIWLYLPEDYNIHKKNYPVLYLQDGQNVFDNYTAAANEWGVDEYLDTAIKNGAPPCIVVAIENSVQRITEYNPYNHEKYGDGKGDAYVQFIIDEVKPFIDKNYRTLTSKENTIIAGSSLGGLISLYATLQYADVFGKGGFISPAFWIANGLKADIENATNNVNGKYFFSIGNLEGQQNIEDVINIQEKLATNTASMIYSIIVNDGKHDEANWRTIFPIFYQWIMADGSNIITNKAD